MSSVGRSLVSGFRTRSRPSTPCHLETDTEANVASPVGAPKRVTGSRRNKTDRTLQSPLAFGAGPDYCRRQREVEDRDGLKGPETNLMKVSQEASRTRDQVGRPVPTPIL